MARKLYGREYVVRVDTIETDYLDVRFDITRTKGKEPNTAEIAVYNLSPQHRAQIENLRGRIRVEVEAGYKGERALIFRGDLRYAVTEREGPDFVTRIEGDDGGKALLGATVNRSFAAGTPVTSVVRACFAALGLGNGNLSELEATLRTQGGATFTGGTVLYGPADKELDRVLRSCGYRYSIQNGVPQITRPGKPLQARAVLLTSDDIDAPTVNPDGTIEVVAPLVPDLFPGGRVQLDTERKRGLYGIEKVNYVGDSSADSNDWHARLTLKPT